ncbi:uncharacterized protein JCM6883_000938 [Sporobolomyces salmoneus]|uniref:uncharacterized protein n=1 Tax=Sporobolomyces salmoneus TaxID=183962 RepID=UPI003180EBFE
MASFSEWLSARIGRMGFKRWLIIYAIGALLFWFNLNRSTSHAPSTAGDDDERIGLPQLELPKVDRSALEKLRLLEIHEGVDEEHDQETQPRNKALDRPPLVKEIPEIEKGSALLSGRFDKVPAEILDREVCGATAKGHGCQFLVPAWLGEQETKAQQHLYQLGLLALATNRTLVLPNVSKSRMGTCYRHPFSFYYSPGSLSSLGIPTISQEDFLLWTLQRDPPPSAQVVSIVNARPGVYPEGSVEIDSFADPFAPTAKPNRNLCLRSPRSKLDFNSNSPLAIYPPEGYHKSETGRLGFGQSVINTLLSSEVGAKSSRRSSSNHYDYTLPDVYAFNYEMRFPIVTPESVVAHLSSSSSSSSDSASADEDPDYFDESPPPSPSITPVLPFSHFPYANTWSLLADTISSRLSPFISIHWRTETLTPSNLSPCSDSLLDKIFSLKRLYPEIQNVYLATDYPIEQIDPAFATQGGSGGEVAHSGTFAKVITEQHHKVMRKFLKNFEYRARRIGGGLGLTTFAKEQNEISLDPTISTLPPSLLSELLNLTSPLTEPDDGEPRSTTLDLGSVDSGLLGILDKLIVTKSQIFLSGVPGVGSSTEGACAKLSSFTLQLIGAREELIVEQESVGENEEERWDGTGVKKERKVGQLWNTVQHWSLNGAEVD